MKILVFTTLYPNNVWPNHGVFVKERMTAVARLKGYEVRVVAPVPYYPPLKLGRRAPFRNVVRSEMIEGVQVYHPRYLMIPKIGMLLHGLLMFLSVLLFVKKIRKAFPFDVIDAHYVYPDGFAAVLLGHALHTPTVVSARGSDINVFSRLPVVRRLVVVTLRRASAVIAVSEALKAMIYRLGVSQKKVSLIPNGVDPIKFCRVPQSEARKLLRLPLDQAIILSVGGLNRVKGFDLLIRAFKLLLDEKKGTKVSLLIVGDGPLREDLTGLIVMLGLTSHVRLVGEVSHSELYRWYSAANILCLASEREGRPNVVLEALSCGLPVVATSVGGIPEIVDSERIGLLSERDARSLSDTLERALTRQWDADAIKSATQNYAWQDTARKVVNLFDAVLKASGGSSIIAAESTKREQAVEQ